MKKILFLLLFPVTGFAQNQYVDSSFTGSSNGTVNFPWKTMSAINQGALNAGDSVLFKRGYNYPGSMNITKGGTVGNAIVYTSYGTGTRAKLIGTGSTITALFYMNGPDYVTFTNFDITDPTLNAADAARIQLAKIQRAFYVDGASNNIITSYMDVTLVGVGCFWVGGNNAMLYCDYSNMRMVEDDIGGFNDYGANPITIGTNSSNNLVSHCNLRNLWAHSYDFTYDGGAFEMYGPTGTMTNNVFEYNLIDYGIGVSEITGNTNGFYFNYNIIINNGSFLNFQPGYSHTNTRCLNNVFVLTAVSLVLDNALLYNDIEDIQFQNCAFYMRAGCDIAHSSTSGSTPVHAYNYYNLGSGSVIGWTAGGTEVTNNSLQMWLTMAGDPNTWDYHAFNSSVMKDGSAIGGLSIDYYGLSGANDYMGVAKFFTSPASNQIKFPVKINGKVYMKFQ